MSYDPESVSPDLELMARMFAKLLMHKKEIKATIAFASIMVMLHDDHKDELLTLATNELEKVLEKRTMETLEEWPDLVEEMRKDAEKN